MVDQLNSLKWIESSDYLTKSAEIFVICGPEASDKVPDASIEDEHEHEDREASSLTPETFESLNLEPINPEP
jgi:hypothetical protein